MSCACDRKLTYYKYYDTPDGCDIMDKTIVTARYGAVTGFLFSTMDVLMYSHAVGVLPVLKRYAYHMVPLSLMGATFSLVANNALHFRQKDDHINYLLGGLICGPILGAYLRSGHAAFLGGIALGVIGMLKKNAIDNDYTILGAPKGHMGSITGWRHDFTFRPDPKDEWRQMCDTDD